MARKRKEIDRERLTYVCPYLREFKRVQGTAYIGKLTRREFDWIDLFMVSAQPMRALTVADRLGLQEQTVERYFRMMQQAGIMGICKWVEEMTVIAQRSNQPDGPWAMPDRSHEQRHYSKTLMMGPTMKGVMLWHDALGEGWEWEDYDGQDWIARPGLHTERAIRVA